MTIWGFHLDVRKYPLDKSLYPPQMYLPDTVYTQTETDRQNQETDDIIDHPNDINLPLTSDQTDWIDNSPYEFDCPFGIFRPSSMDLSTDVNQVLVVSPTKTLSPEIMTQVPVNSTPMDLSPDILRFFDDADFMTIGKTRQTLYMTMKRHKTYTWHWPTYPWKELW